MPVPSSGSNSITTWTSAGKRTSAGSWALYQRSTPGTHIEDKRTGIVWHYRQADPEFGRWKANQLVDELSIVAANNPVEVRHGRKIVEASSARHQQGAAREKHPGDADYELILLAGDDTTDETMFRLAAA